MTRLSIVDAHHHVWNPDVNYHPWLRDKPVKFRYGDYAPIRRHYLVPNYLADAKNFHVAGSVYVEAEWDPTDPIGEMEYIAAVRRESRYPSVAVGQIWLDRADAAATIERLADFDFVRSVRQKPRANASASDNTPGGMTESRWRAGFAQLRSRGLRFDLQTPWWHLREAVALARDFPDTQIIINHAGLPANRSANGLAAWRAAMAQVAECPNVAVKISGIGVPGQPWTAAANREVVMTTIDLFGVDRCMFASNFPVDSLCASFDDIYDGFLAITSGFSPDERALLFHDNAVRIYAIPPEWLHAEAKDPLIPAKAGIQDRVRRSE